VESIVRIAWTVRSHTWQGKIEGTIWAGPPADLVAAAAVLIDDEAEFERLFIQVRSRGAPADCLRASSLLPLPLPGWQKPEDAKKKKKKEGSGAVQLLDGKRAMNVGIALAKLHASAAGVVACLTTMCARAGRTLLSLTEVMALPALCPTEEETRTLKGYKGDPARLGPPEQFLLALAEVPAARAVADGLLYQATFDERVREATARIALFREAVDAVAHAARLQRLLKAILVLGNKMNGVTAKARKGLTRAFTVNSLHQLHVTKAFDGQTSVLQYLIRILRHKDPDLLRVASDFRPGLLAEAKRLPLDVMGEEMKELRGGLTQLEELVREATSSGGGWGGVAASAGAGPDYVEEEVETGPKTAGDGEADDGDAAAGAGAGEGGDGGERAVKKKKKRIRRRVEPLPAFAAAAQGEMAGLESAFSQAQEGYKSECTLRGGGGGRAGAVSAVGVVTPQASSTAHMDTHAAPWGDGVGNRISPDAHVHPKVPSSLAGTPGHTLPHWHAPAQ